MNVVVVGEQSREVVVDEVVLGTDDVVVVLVVVVVTAEQGVLFRLIPALYGPVVILCEELYNVQVSTDGS